jgi:transposase
MGGTGAAPAISPAWRSPSQCRLARSGQRHLVRPAQRLPLAHVAPRLAPLGHRLVVFPPMAEGWDLGTDPRDLAPQGAGGSRARTHSQCRYYRQPIGEDHRKRGLRGYDAGKKVTGRKRHIVVDTLGLLLVVVVHAARIQDRDGAKLVLTELLGRFPRLQLIWADGAYAGKLIDWAYDVGSWLLQIVNRPADTQRFQVLPRRWVVERTLAWLGRCRRLSKDYEALPETSEAWVQIAMIHLMLRRLKPA